MLIVRVLFLQLIHLFIFFLGVSMYGVISTSNLLSARYRLFQTVPIQISLFFIHVYMYIEQREEWLNKTLFNKSIYFYIFKNEWRVCWNIQITKSILVIKDIIQSERVKIHGLNVAVIVSLKPKKINFLFVKNHCVNMLLCGEKIYTTSAEFFFYQKGIDGIEVWIFLTQ